MELSPKEATRTAAEEIARNTLSIKGVETATLNNAFLFVQIALGYESQALVIRESVCEIISREDVKGIVSIYQIQSPHPQ
jgi:hypothetical protein